MCRRGRKVRRRCPKNYTYTHFFDAENTRFVSAFTATTSTKARVALAHLSRNRCFLAQPSCAWSMVLGAAHRWAPPHPWRAVLQSANCSCVPSCHGATYLVLFPVYLYTCIPADAGSVYPSVSTPVPLSGNFIASANKTKTRKFPNAH